MLTHEPFYPPSGGGSAEAVYLAREFVRRGHSVHVFCPAVAEPERVEREFGVRLHPFTLWQMGRYTSLRSLKYRPARPVREWSTCFGFTVDFPSFL